MHTFVTTAALAVCTATLAGPFNTPHAAALTTADDIPTETPIKHLVVVFQENASFDHYFGTYPNAANPVGDPPFVARDRTPTVNNLLPSSLNGNRDLLATNPNQAKPFRLERSQFVTCSQDHGYKAEQRAANGGLMNRFVQAANKEPPACLAALPRTVPSPQVMGYFDGNTVTALWNYAQHFALNDKSFGTNYGPSTPGALNLAAGRTSGASGNDPGTVTDGALFGDADPMYDECKGTKTAELTGPNVGDLLTQAGIPWGWFQGGFALDPSKSTAEACEDTHPNLAGNDDENYEAHHNPFQYFASTANPAHARPSSVMAIGHDDEANHLYDLDDFWDAAGAGDLPAVSFLKAPGYQDGHPGPQNSNPLDEQDFLVDTLNELQKLPEWSSTAVVLAWDDSDGWYDHEPPPNPHNSGNLSNDGLYGTTASTLCLAPLGQPAPDPSTIFEMRCGYGERLPLLIVSPYAQENYVDHTLTDQTSVLHFIEDNWGLGRLGHGSFDAEAGSLLKMFDFGKQRDDTLILNHFTGNPNQAPLLGEPELTPATPTTDDVVMASATATDPDRDPTNPGRQDTVTLSYQWFNGTTPLAETGPTLDLSVPGNGDRGDTVTVRVTAGDDLGATSSSKTASVQVGNSAPTVSLGSPSGSVSYSDALAPIDVTTFDADSDDVTVDAIGLPDGLHVSRTDGGGWRISGHDQGPAGVYDATVRASDGTEHVETPLQIGVQRESAHVGYTGDLMFSTGSATTSTAPVVLRAHVVQDQDGAPGDLAEADVLFDLYAPGNASGVPNATYPASPDQQGDARFDVGPLARGTWTVGVRTDPSSGFFEAPDSDAVSITVHAPTTRGSATGAGWVHDPGYLDRPVPISTHDHGYFALDARLRKDGTPIGVVAYSFTGSDGNRYVVSSTGWQRGGVAIAGHHATMAGTCDITVLDPTSHVVSRLREDAFRLDVSDVRQADTFAMSVYTPDGTLYHRVGTPGVPLRLGGGQVVVHP